MVLTLRVWAGGLRSRPSRARKRGSRCTLAEPAWGYLYQLSSSTSEPSPLITKLFLVSLPPLFSINIPKKYHSCFYRGLEENQEIWGPLVLKDPQERTGLQE